jgi:hypothetical protein
MRPSQTVPWPRSSWISQCRYFRHAALRRCCAAVMEGASPSASSYLDAGTCSCYRVVDASRQKLDFSKTTTLTPHTLCLLLDLQHLSVVSWRAYVCQRPISSDTHLNIQSCYEQRSLKFFLESLQRAICETKAGCWSYPNTPSIRALPLEVLACLKIMRINFLATILLAGSTTGTPVDYVLSALAPHMPNSATAAPRATPSSGCPTPSSMPSYIQEVLE